MPKRPANALPEALLSFGRVTLVSMCPNHPPKRLEGHSVTGVTQGKQNMIYDVAIMIWVKANAMTNGAIAKGVR